MRLAAAIGIAVAIAACTSIVPAPPIGGTEWRVSAINGQATPPPPSPYRMSFKAGTLGGQFGCNHLGGDYRVSGDMLTTGAVAMTEMACMGPDSHFESWGLAIIQRPMLIDWHDTGRVRLSNEAGSINLAR